MSKKVHVAPMLHRCDFCGEPVSENIACFRIPERVARFGWCETHLECYQEYLRNPAAMKEPTR
jgi:hypothetical protein